MEVHLFAAAAYFDCCNRSQGPCYGPFKLTPSYYINLIGVISLFVYYGPPPTTRDAVSAAALEKICARPPTPWAVWVHQIHAAGGASGSTTTVMVFVRSL